MCVCVCAYIYIYIYMCVCVCVCVCVVCVCVCVSIYYSSVCLSIYLTLPIHIYQSTFHLKNPFSLSLSLQSVYLSLNIPDLSIYLSIYRWRNHILFHSFSSSRSSYLSPSIQIYSSLICSCLFMSC